MKQGFDECNLDGSGLVCLDQFTAWFPKHYSYLSEAACAAFYLLPEKEISIAHDFYVAYGGVPVFPMMEFKFWCAAAEYLKEKYASDDKVLTLGRNVFLHGS